MFFRQVAANTTLFGKSLERKAADYLKTNGLKLFTRNYSCKVGEIDLVMTDGDRQLVFVEVRYRRGDEYGSALESVGLNKQRKLRSTAAHFLQTHPHCARLACRFDVVAVLASENEGKYHFDWIKNAFY